MPELRPWQNTAAATRLRFHLAAVCAAVLLSILIAPHPLFFPLDDAYITIHNADVLLSGVDPNYGVSPLTGATSLIHLLLVAFATLFLPSPAAIFAVGLVGIGLYVAALGRIAFQLGGSVVTAALFVTFGVLVGTAPFQLLNGLETGLAMAAVAWAISLALTPALSIRLPLLCGLMPFLRPELAALSAVLMLRQVGLRAREGDYARAVRDVVLAGIVALPFLAWTWMSLGSLVPTTAKAKELFFPGQGAPWRTKAAGLLLGLVAYGLLPVAAAAALAWRAKLWLPLTIFIASFVLALWLTFPSAFLTNYGRYFFVLVPAWLYLALDLTQSARRRGTRRLLFAVLAVSTLLMLPISIREYTGDEQLAAREYVSLAAWLNANLPPDAVVLIHDAGYLAYATRFRLVDVVGLKTPGSIAYHRACTAPSGGRDRRRAVSAIALASGARYAVFMQDPAGFWSALATDLASTGWNVRAVRQPSMPNGYTVYALTPPADTRLPCRP